MVIHGNLQCNTVVSAPQQLCKTEGTLSLRRWFRGILKQINNRRLLEEDTPAVMKSFTWIGNACLEAIIQISQEIFEKT